MFQKKAQAPVVLGTRTLVALDAGFVPAFIVSRTVSISQSRKIMTIGRFSRSADAEKSGSTRLGLKPRRERFDQKARVEIVFDDQVSSHHDAEAVDRCLEGRIEDIAEQFVRDFYIGMS